MGVILNYGQIPIVKEIEFILLIVGILMNLHQEETKKKCVTQNHLILKLKNQ